MKIADVLRGRDSHLHPHRHRRFRDVINADKARDRNKETDKEYQRYSGYRD